MSRIHMMACGIIALVLALTISVGGRWMLVAAAQPSQNPAVIPHKELIYPRVKVLLFQDFITRFDTQTGQMSRFSGSLASESATGKWLPLVEPINEPNSGYLDLEHVRGATFLIDMVTGEVWVLRREGDAIGFWNHIVRGDRV